MAANKQYTAANEAWIIKQCMLSDRLAQKYIFDAYADNMLLVCMRYIKNMEDARSAMLSGFHKFFTKVDTFTYLGQGSVQAWLKKIVVNECLMHLRATARYETVADERQLQDVADTDDALSALSVKEIMKLIQELPDGYRTVFNLYVFEQKQHKEIAVLLGISGSTSKTQLYKARLMMQRKLLALNH